MASSQSSSTLPQGFSIFQPTLGAQLQFFPAVGTQELDDMINAYMPGPASIQEKRATVAVDFLEFAQLTGQTFKFYTVRSAVESPFSDSISSFNASPAASSWDWSQASASSPGSSTSRQPRKSSAGTASRHQTADFSHLPGMKIMTKDGRDITNTASRGSKTKEQRDHAHLMRIIKACDSCKRKKIRCDPSHKKRSAASQAQPSQSSKVAKKARASPQPAKAQQPAASPPILAADGLLSQIPIDWDASFTFDDLEVPDFAMLYEPTEELASQVDLIPHDYDFFFDPEGYFSPKTSFSSSSSSSASPAKLASPVQSLGDPSTSVTLAPEEAAAQASLHSMPVPYHDSAGSVDSYADFNLYSPMSSFSEDENMVSIEASSERFSTRSVSQSPAQQSESESAANSSQPLPFASPGDSWFNDGLVISTESSAEDPVGVCRPEAASAPDRADEFYDAEWLCAPVSGEPWRVPSLLSASGRGASNGDLIGAYETSVTSDGVFQRPRRDQTVTNSSTNSYGRSSTTTETVTHSSTDSCGRSLTTTKTVTHSSTNSCGHSSTTTEVESVVRDRTPSVEAASQLRRIVNTKDQAPLAGRVSVKQTPDATTAASAVSTDLDGRHSVPSVPSAPSAPSALLALTDLQLGGLTSASSSVDSGIVSSLGSPLQQRSDIQQQRHSRPESGSSTSTSQSMVNHQTTVQQSVSRLQTMPVLPVMNAPRIVDVSSTSSADIPHPGTNTTLWEVARDVSVQRPTVGIRRPVVATLAPLSSQATLCVLGMMVLYAVLRSVSATSLMLSAAAVSVHAVGTAVLVQPSERRIDCKGKPCVRMSIEDDRRKMVEDAGRLFGGLSNLSPSRLGWSGWTSRLLTI